MITFSDPEKRLATEASPLNDSYMETALSMTVLRGLYTARRLASGDVWSSQTYLQMFFASPPPGVYRVEYTVSCFDSATLSDYTTGSGSFKVTVGPPDEAKLQNIFAAYQRRSESGDESERRTASWALFSTSSSLVLPALINLPVSPLGFTALSRFAGDPRVEDIMSTSLHSNDAAIQILALGVLWKWNRKLSEPDMDGLLKSESSVRIAALHYARMRKDVTYLPLVTRLVNDPDNRVMEEAKKTKAALEGSNK